MEKLETSEDLRSLDSILRKGFSSKSILSSEDQITIKKLENTYIFEEWIEFTPTKVAKVSRKKDRQWMVIKFVTDYEDYLHEKTVLIALKGAPHIITLEDSFEISKWNCFGLITLWYNFRVPIQWIRNHHQIKTFMQYLLEAIHSVHEKGYIHRDINPSNIGLKINRQMPEINDLLLADFGLAVGDDEEDVNVLFEKRVGTAGYISPEMMLITGDSVDQLTDIWSAGVIFAELLSGKRGIFARGNKNVESFEVLETETARNKWLTELGLDDISKPEIELLFNLLALDPAKRFTAAQALKHSYFSE